MSLPFPSGRTLDRGARTSSDVGTAFVSAAACAPVESSEEVATAHQDPLLSHPVTSSGPLVCDPCVTGTHCSGFNKFCGCLCAEVDDTGEEFVPHENDETLEAMRSEGAYDFLDDLYAEVYPAPRGWSI